MDRERRFEGIWDAHYGAVLAYARRRTSPEVAADVASDTFLVAWRRLNDVPDDPLPWLLGVARLTLANHARSARRGRALVGRLAMQPPEWVPDPAEHAGGSSLLAAMARLSPRDRDTLALLSWEGLEPRRAALVAGCTAAVFSVRLSRARRRLRAALDEIEREQGKPRPLAVEEEPT